MKKLLLLTLLLALFATPAFADEIVSLNKASVDELLAIPDTFMTKAQAEAIVKYRNDNGPYNYTDDLLKVPGLTRAVWEALMLVETDDGDVVSDPDGDSVSFAPSKC